MIGLVGKKLGMTRTFTKEGISIPITVIEVEANRVTQVKTLSTDGYCAIQVTTGSKKASRINKPTAGHFAEAGKVKLGRTVSKKARKTRKTREDTRKKMNLETGEKLGVKAGRGLWEFRSTKSHEYTVGNEINVKILINIKKVDVTGISKGKGFSGTVKRWNFRTQDATHGNSLSHRVPGSIGQNQTPGKVFKGKKMAGQLGNERITIQNLDVVYVDVERNLLLVKGAVPGATGSNLIVKPAVKA